MNRTSATIHYFSSNSNDTYELDEVKIKTKRKISLIGLGQCGSFKQKVIEQLKPRHKLDCPTFSYTSAEKIELTIFLRHNDYWSSYLLFHFQKEYLKWHDTKEKEDELEYQYLMKNVGKKSDHNNFLKDVLTAIEAEKECNDDKWLEKNFNYKIEMVK